ncbi:phosphoglucomutase/phosphomannomutase family protein [Clostridiales bacterium COT073_COT-073]|nr:phosphoglucomutase/phosphomannomutase family protein [Clostridiales bacterium COT073_COT-073]
MIQFGTGGWRAIIGDSFTRENIVKVAQSLANLMKKENADKKGLVIGYDKRFLSDKSARWISEVLAGNDIPVYFIRRVAPTPLVMFSVKTLGTLYGVAVTASHNPAEYNGIKVFTEGGKDADIEVTNKMEKDINTMTVADVRTMPFDEAVSAGKIEMIHPFNDYIDTIISMIDMDSIRKQNLRILVDPMYGVSKTALQTLLMTARCEIDTIHDSHDPGFGGRMPSPSEETLRHLRNLVVEKQYDLGIGTDGDADRLGIIDETGLYIHPNMIMSLLYYYLLNYKNWRGPVVRNIATTHLLDAIAEDAGEKCHEVPVGFKHISSKMAETDAVIGGESSGGLTIRGHIKGKDGIFAAALLVEMICVTGKRLGEMMKEMEEKFGSFQMEEANISFHPKEKEQLVRLLFEEKKLPEFHAEVERVSYLDGVKVYFKDNSWIIARFSGTEPLIRIFAESDTSSRAYRFIMEFREFLGI